DDARGAEDDRDSAGAVDPHPERRRRLVARTRDLGRLVDLRQPRTRNLERVEDVVAPAPPTDVQEERPRRIGHVHEVLAGETKADVVLRQADPGDVGVHLWLVAAKPEELRRGEPR